MTGQGQRPMEVTQSLKSWRRLGHTLTFTIGRPQPARRTLCVRRPHTPSSSRLAVKVVYSPARLEASLAVPTSCPSYPTAPPPSASPPPRIVGGGFSKEYGCGCNVRSGGGGAEIWPVPASRACCAVIAGVQGVGPTAAGATSLCDVRCWCGVEEGGAGAGVGQRAQGGQLIARPTQQPGM